MPTPLTPETSAALFRAAGAALYGPEWRGRAADLLSVAKRQVRRWEAEGYVVPDGVWRTLLAALEAKVVEDATTLRQLRAAVAALA